LIYNGSFFVFQNAAAGEIGDIKSSVLSANHNEWYLCNGQELARLDFPELFALIGTNFGAGDSATTFNLPDYRGKFLRGLGGNSAADIYTTQAEGLPNITGSISSSVDFLGIFAALNSGAFSPSSRYGFSNGNEGAVQYDNAVTVNFSAANSNSIYGASDHVTPINQAINYFIKVR
jgi:microcystin-dependent protein